jgi:hypothetical protein
MANLATQPTDSEIMEQVLIQGDLSKLTADQRRTYYMRVCDSVGLNPLTKPFDYITLNNKLTLYAKRDCTDQLRQIRGVSCSITSRERIEDVYIVTARATLADGRSDESTGVVAIANLKGDTLANALMKAETKAKRRVTLSICGLGWTDETEVDSIPRAKRADVDVETGEINGPVPIDAEIVQSTPASDDQKARVKELWEAIGDREQATNICTEAMEHTFKLKDLTASEADMLVAILSEVLRQREKSEPEPTPADPEQAPLIGDEPTGVKPPGWVPPGPKE